MTAPLHPGLCFVSEEIGGALTRARVLINRRAVSAFGQTGHRADIAE
jgi:hypothetical protein